MPELRALVIDGDEGFREVLNEALRPTFGELHFAPVGEDPCDRLVFLEPELVWIAVDLPDRAGFRTFTAIKQLDRQARVVLATRTLAPVEFSLHAKLKLHADLYLDKQELSAEELRERVLALELVARARSPARAAAPPPAVVAEAAAAGTPWITELLEDGMDLHTADALESLGLGTESVLSEILKPGEKAPERLPKPARKLPPRESPALPGDQAELGQLRHEVERLQLELAQARVAANSSPFSRNYVELEGAHRRAVEEAGTLRQELQTARPRLQRLRQGLIHVARNFSELRQEKQRLERVVEHLRSAPLQFANQISQTHRLESELESAKIKAEHSAELQKLTEELELQYAARLAQRERELAEQQRTQDAAHERRLAELEQQQHAQQGELQAAHESALADARTEVRGEAQKHVGEERERGRRVLQDLTREHERAAAQFQQDLEGARRQLAERQQELEETRRQLEQLQETELQSGAELARLRQTQQRELEGMSLRHANELQELEQELAARKLAELEEQRGHFREELADRERIYEQQVALLREQQRKLQIEQDDALVQVRRESDLEWGAKIEAERQRVRGMVEALARVHEQAMRDTKERHQAEVERISQEREAAQRESAGEAEVLEHQRAELAQGVAKVESLERLVGDLQHSNESLQLILRDVFSSVELGAHGEQPAPIELIEGETEGDCEVPTLREVES